MKRGFLLTMGFLIVFSLFCTLSGYLLDKTKISENLSEKTYEYRIFRLNPKAYEFMGKYRPEKYEEFVERVLDFVNIVDVYDICYYDAFVKKGWVVTERKPEVIFFQDGKTALVWWWLGYKKYQKTPEQIKKMLEERKRKESNE